MSYLARQLRLREYSADLCSDNNDDLQLLPAWTPNHGCGPALDMYIKFVTQDVLRGIIPCAHGHKLTKTQSDTIKALASLDDIVFTPADEDRAMVVWPVDRCLRIQWTTQQRGTLHGASAGPL